MLVLKFYVVFVNLNVETQYFASREDAFQRRKILRLYTKIITKKIPAFQRGFNKHLCS